MTFRCYLASIRTYIRGVRKIRRDFITSKTYKAVPFRTRLWHGHLIWLPRAVYFLSERTCTLVWRRCVPCYYRTADRIFGGTRYAQYLERLDAAIRRMDEDLAEQKRKVAEMDERIFAFGLLEQALTNPNFVVNDHIHQDR